MESKSSSLPTFIVIGAMKSGTSSLHKYLGMHPEIGMSLKKELDFFKSKIFYSNGLDWYKNQFSDQYPFRGESSPNYTKCHEDSGIAERMHNILPNIKLIYVVRNPIERIVSHYVHNYSNGRESRGLLEVLENKVNNNYLETGLYMFQLKQFLKYYERDQILLIKPSVPKCCRTYFDF
jgi:Sulfotransferase domain